MCSQWTKSEQIAQCLHITSFGQTPMSLQTNSDTINADVYMFVCGTSNNCHLAAKRHYIFPTQRFTNGTSLSPAAVMITACWVWIQWNGMVDWNGGME